MRNLLSSTAFFLIVTFLAVLTTGCPVGIAYPLGKPGTEKIDTKLIGVWQAKSDSAEMVKLEVGKKDDFTYWVEVLQTGESYMAESTSFDAWVTKIDGQNFIYSKPTDPAAEEFFVYQYAVNGKSLAIQDVSLLIGGMDAVTSTEAFRNEVSASLKLPDCLTSKLEYQKQ